MKKVFWMLSSLALVGFGFVGCEEEDSVPCGGCDEGKICASVTTDEVNHTNASDQCVPKDKLKAACLNGDKLAEGKIIIKAGDDYRCSDVNNNTHQTACTKDSECTNGTDNWCNPTSKLCDKNPNNVYKYVRVDDNSGTGKSGSNPGADIDAILITGSDNAVKGHAVDVVFYKRGDGKTSGKNAESKAFAGDPSNVLGNPDSLTAYGTANAKCKFFKDNSTSINKAKCDVDGNDYCGKDKTGAELETACAECDFDYTFYSLGGTGGQIIVEMNTAIVEGDKINVIELGGCSLENTAGGGTGNAKKELMKVFVSVSRGGADDSFRAVGGTNKEQEASQGVAVFEIAAGELAAAAQ